jgi:glycosyltransferase involved in cell wall biosynthesis
VISCLRRAGVEVAERHVPVWEGREHKYTAGVGAALRLTAAELKLRRRVEEEFDAVVVGYPGHLDLGAARRVAKGRPVVFNPLVSVSDTLVADRGRFRAGSLAERGLRWIDRRALDSADLVVSDTEANADLFRSLGARRVEVCFVGAEERVFQPGWTGGDNVLFVGKLIPLHGLETILAAARLAPDLRFRVVGSGQLDRLLDDRPPNVAHVPWIEYELLPDELHHAACAIGVVGTSDKSARVIANKVFQALACGTPVVTGDTPAARELLRDGESAVLVRPGDPQALADAIRRVTPEIGAGGLAAYREHASEEVLGARWRQLLEGLL